MDFENLIIGARDYARCLDERKKLAFPIPLLTGILPLVQDNLTADTGADFKVTIQRKDFDPKDITSCLFRYKDGATILYGRNLNKCWARFAICKELAHLALDTSTGLNTAYTALAQALITGIQPDMHLEEAFSSEKLCTLAAIELLMPWRIRSQLTRMRDAGSTDYQIACKCSVPEPYVTFLLRSQYEEFSASYHRQVDKSESDLV